MKKVKHRFHPLLASCQVFCSLRERIFGFFDWFFFFFLLLLPGTKQGCQFLLVPKKVLCRSSKLHLHVLLFGEYMYKEQRSNHRFYMYVVDF